MAGSPAPLVLSGMEDGTTWGLASLRVPGRIARVAYYPDHPEVSGSKARAAALQQGILSFAAFPDVTSEAAQQAAFAELAAAIGRFSYTLTTTVAGAAGQVWSCDWGSIELEDSSGRTFEDLADSKPLYVVSIPVYPIPS